MNRKTKPENDAVVPPDAAASRARRQTAASRTRRAAASAATPVSPTADVDGGMTPESASSVAAAKPRRKAPTSQTTRKPTKGETAAVEPSREAVAQLAYLYWQARGGQDGSADDDWIRAERELRQRASK
jgi:hypothetical protein